MFPRIALTLGWLRRLGASRSNLLIENLALRQQLAILTAKRPRPRMRVVDRFFWVTLRRFWPRWKAAGRLADDRQLVKHRRLPGDVGEETLAVALREMNVDAVRSLDDVEKVKAIRPHTRSGLPREPRRGLQA